MIDPHLVSQAATAADQVKALSNDGRLASMFGEEMVQQIAVGVIVALLSFVWRGIWRLALLSLAVAIGFYVLKTQGVIQ